MHGVNDSEISENIMDAIKEASRYKSGSQKEKLMDAIQHLHPRPLSNGEIQLQHCHIISQNGLQATRLEMRCPSGRGRRGWTIQMIRRPITGKAEGNGVAKIKDEESGEGRTRKIIYYINPALLQVFFGPSDLCSCKVPKRIKSEQGG